MKLEVKKIECENDFAYVVVNQLSEGLVYFGGIEWSCRWKERIFDEVNYYRDEETANRVIKVIKEFYAQN